MNRLTNLRPLTSAPPLPRDQQLVFAAFGFMPMLLDFLALSALPVAA